jgi:hypothetical protein
MESFTQPADPLTELTGKDSAWKGGPFPVEAQKAQKAFEKLQSKLSSKPCLTQVDFNQKFIFTVDSSSIGELKSVGMYVTRQSCGPEYCARAALLVMVKFCLGRWAESFPAGLY